MTSIRIQSFLSAALLSLAISAVGQVVIPLPPGSDVTPESSNAAELVFEAASVKAVSADAPVEFIGVAPEPDGIRVSGTLAVLIRDAFGGVTRFPTDDSVVGAPEWAGTQRYDIEAKMSAKQAVEFKKLSVEDQQIQRQRMERSLLEDRFNVKLHAAAEQADVYELVVLQGDAKLKCAENTSKSGAEAKPGSGGWMQMWGPGKLEGHAFDMVQFVNYLSQPWVGLGRRVIDKTGLKGGCDFTLEWSPAQNVGHSSDDASSPAGPEGGGGGPSLPMALEEQMGLRLHPASAQVDVLVIDDIEQPIDLPIELPKEN